MTMRRIWTPQPYEDYKTLKAYFCGGIDKIGLPVSDDPLSPAIVPYYKGWVEGLDDGRVLMASSKGNYTQTGLIQEWVGNRRQYPLYRTRWAVVPIAFSFHGVVNKVEDSEVWVDEETYMLKILPFSPLWDEMFTCFIHQLGDGFLNLYVNWWFEFLFPYKPEYVQDTGVPLWGYDSIQHKVWNTDLYLVFEKDAVYITTGEGWKLYQFPYDDFTQRVHQYIYFEQVSCLNEEPPPMVW